MLSPTEPVIAAPYAPFHMVLVEPEIPGNTGSIGRVCAGTGAPLHLVGPLGFSLEDRYLKRAGLDYWPHIDLHRHRDFDSLCRTYPESRFWLFSKTATQLLWDVPLAPHDMLVFGSETRGLPPELLKAHPDRMVKIPISSNIRSLNLANAASIALYEGIRQVRGLDTTGSQ